VLNAAGVPGEVLDVHVIRVEHPPKLDGRLDDTAWRGAALHGSTVIAGLQATGADLANCLPLAFLAYDETNLYVATRSFTPDIDALSAKSTQEQFTWRDDLVQVFLEPHLDGVLKHVGINCEGLSSDPAVKAAVSRDSISWTAEIAIPWEHIGVTPAVGKKMGFNLVANQTTTGDGWISWAVLYGSALNTDRFGYIHLEPAKHIPHIPSTPEEDDF